MIAAARLLAERAVELRGLAGRAVSTAADTRWRSPAGRAFDARIISAAQQIFRLSFVLDEAGAQLQDRAARLAGSAGSAGPAEPANPAGSAGSGPP